MQPAGDGGLARFQSAPATWLEALLLSDEDIILDPLKSTINQYPSISTTNFADSSLILPSPDSGLLLQNSSPMKFLLNINNSDDDMISNYGIPTKANYDECLSSSVTRFRDVNLEDSQVRFTTHLPDVEMENIVLDSIPFSVRAKRGFATHPRSIVERVRRTRISDRIRKLQELVPNTDKQTNTVDMLEEAVKYVKFLQNQIQDLTQQQTKCTCCS